MHFLTDDMFLFCLAYIFLPYAHIQKRINKPVHLNQFCGGVNLYIKALNLLEGIRRLVVVRCDCQARKRSMKQLFDPTVHV